MVDTQKVLMIIEDDPDNLDTLTMFFSGEGYLVRVAPSRDAALNILQQFEAPDVILSDWHMPGMSVPEFLTAVRRIDPAVELLIMSANDEVNESARNLNLDFVRKPPDLVDLHRQIESKFARRRVSRGQ